MPPPIVVPETAGSGLSAWVTVNHAPAEEIVAIRAAPLLGDTLQFSVPFPTPVPPAVMFSQFAEGSAVQAQD